MQIYAHRGLWRTPEQQNSLEAISDASRLGFANEIDIRTIDGKIVASHDPVDLSKKIGLNQLLDENRLFALNIKEDGLISSLGEMLNKIETSGSFFFDGSLPQMYEYSKKGLPHALRLSEFEKTLPWQPQFLWIDAFESDWWIQNKSIRSYLDKYSCVFVSPELHSREKDYAWDFFLELKDDFAFGVCTDFPVQLEELGK